MVYVPLMVAFEIPTPKVAIGLPVITNPDIGSVTTTLLNVVLPVLVTVKV